MAEHLYEKVYDKSGEMFEVTPERAALLRLNHGWSSAPPEPAPVPFRKAPPVVDAPPPPEVKGQ